MKIRLKTKLIPKNQTGNKIIPSKGTVQEFPNMLTEQTNKLGYYDKNNTYIPGVTGYYLNTGQMVLPFLKVDNEYNISLPNVEVTPKNINLEAVVDKGKREAAPYIGAIVGGAAIPAMGPSLLTRTKAVLANPIVDTALTIDGVRNALSGEGILKTYRLAKDGLYLKALGSGAIDALDLMGVGNLVRNFNKSVGTIGKDVVARVTHPTYKKYYHGSPTPFNIKEAWMGTPSDMGLHMGDKRIAEKMAGKDGIVYEFYAPRPKLETIDNHFNDITLFTGNKYLKARPQGFVNFYDTTKHAKKWNNILKKIWRCNLYSRK